MKFLLSFLLIFIIAASPESFAQKRRVERAYDYFTAGEYYLALDHFKNAYSKSKDKSTKADMIFMVAQCYRLMNDPKNAEIWYKKAVKTAFSKPETQFWFAESEKKNGKYQPAIDDFKKYKQIAPADARVDEEIRACELSEEWLKNPEAYKVDEMKEINSKNEDFSPAFARDDFGVIYFTSARDDAQGTKTHGATGQNYTDIFESRLDKKGKWSIPVGVEALNSVFEDGTPNLTTDYKEVYFTRCESGKRERKGCMVMHADKKGDSWSEPKNLALMPDSIIAAHPAISPDGLTLYFVSDIKGGFGGKDIYMVTREKPGTAWSKPKNAGPDINTSGDEVFPYVRSDGSLYFSSDGHIGMGGLDIFRAKQQPDGTWQVQNLKPPINSFADDFGIVFKNENESGIFSSTRKGRGNDELYSFELPPLKFNVTGLVKDEKTNTAIQGSLVQLIASDGSNLQVETGTSGDFKFQLKQSVDYIFLASKKGYLKGNEKVTTKGQDKSRDFMVTILLTTIDKPIELPNIFYDFNKWDLRPESMVSLDKLVETLNFNENITIELMSHTDSRDTEEYNLLLSQKRAQSVVDYLVSKGIDLGRLTAKGYGKSRPKVADSEIAAQYSFIKVGQVLNDQFLNSLPNDEQKEIVHQLNRRTEFQVLKTDYVAPKK